MLFSSRLFLAWQRLPRLAISRNCFLDNSYVNIKLKDYTRWRINAHEVLAGSVDLGIRRRSAKLV
jgi:hypothetical protein